MSLPTMPLILDLGGKQYPVPSIEAARDLFVRARNIAEAGVSNVTPAEIVDPVGRIIAHISYNGRVWPGSMRDWKPDQQPLLEARAHREPEWR